MKDERLIRQLLEQNNELTRRVGRLEHLEGSQQYLLAGINDERTIAAGEITISSTRSLYVIDTENDDPTDDLDTINGGTIGQVIIFRPANSARDTTLKDGTGNLNLAGDFALTSTNDTIMLIKVSSNWSEVSRSNNA